MKGLATCDDQVSNIHTHLRKGDGWETVHYVLFGMAVFVDFCF